MMLSNPIIYIIQVVSQKGITFEEFACLAACNTLYVEMQHGNPTASLDKFRDDVRRVTQAGDKIMVVSYSRRVLGQTGDGHFSPIAGRHLFVQLLASVMVSLFFKQN